LRKYIKNDDETLGIAEALLIGYKNDLDKDLVQAYSNTGVVHIIAISGLHLGLIYMVLLWLFDRIPFIKRFKIFKSISIISCLWIFSLLTGASASVLRSAVMFTCIIIGKTIKRQSSIYNSLAASAFILLCYNPYFLWDVGFQLSYLAIIGIISLQKPIHQLLYFETYLIKKIWEMSSITIAAQIITFPICLYYFHQFPNVFLISNLIAVPLSTVILFSEIILICFSWIPFLGIYLGKFVEVSIWLMNDLIICFNKIPFAICKNIYANLFSTYVLYALVICILCWLILENKKFIKYAFLFSILFTSIHAIASIHLM
jgi:competence protein ComEC